MLSTDTVKITLSNSDTSTSQDHTLTFKSRFSGILRGRTSSGNINTAIQKIPNKITEKTRYLIQSLIGISTIKITRNKKSNL